MFLVNAGTPVVAAAYTAQGVNFNGTTTVLTRGAALTGAATGKQGIISFWFKMKGGDASNQLFLEDVTQGSTGLQILRLPDNTMRFQGAGVSLSFQGHTTGTFVNGMGWAHVLCAWDVNISQLQVYITDSSDLAASPTINNVAIDYTATNWGVGARLGPSVFINADVADFYVNSTQTLDMSVASNRRKFISAGLAPVDLGSDGSTPTGTAPIMFFHGVVASWPTNDGSGGGFTLGGSLGTASTNPP